MEQLNMIYNYWCPQCFRGNKLGNPQKTVVLKYIHEDGVYRCPECAWERGSGWSSYYRSKSYHYFVNGETLCGVKAAPRQLRNDPPQSLGVKICKVCKHNHRIHLMGDAKDDA